MYRYLAGSKGRAARISANVAGLWGVARINLNDNLLERTSLPEIKAVLGHEMGHYVLNHTYKGLVMLGVLFVIGFAFLNWGIHFALARWGEQWGIAGITDVAVLPVAIAVVAITVVAAVPLTRRYSDTA